MASNVTSPLEAGDANDFINAVALGGCHQCAGSRLDGMNASSTGDDVELTGFSGHV